MGLQYRPMTDSFRELNRMIVEKQTWDAGHEARMASKGIENLITTSQLNGQRQQQQLTQYKIQEEERKRTPRIVNLSKFVQGKALEDIENKPEVMAHITKVLDDDGIGYSYNPATKVWDHPTEEGETFKSNSIMMKDRIPAIIGFIESNVDTVAGVNENLGVLGQQIKSLDNDIAATKRDPRNTGERIKMMKRRDGLKNKKAEHEAFLTPEGLLRHFTNKEQRLSGYAQKYASMGMSELAAQMQKGADQASMSTRTIMQGILDEKIAGRKTTTNKFTNPTKMYAQEDGAVYNGKIYKKGQSVVKRFNAGQEEMIASTGFDFTAPEDPESDSYNSPVSVYATGDVEYKGKKYKKGDEVKIQTLKGGDMAAPEGFEYADPNDEKANQLGSPQKVFATKDTTYEGKDYKKGDQIQIQFPKDQKTQIPPEDFSFKDPTKPAEKAQTPIMSQKDAIKQIGSDVKTAGMMGDITSVAGGKERDSKVAMMKASANQANSGKGRGKYEGWDEDYHRVMEVTGVEEELYFKNIEEGMSKEEAFEEFEFMIKEEFPGNYVVYRPSRIKEQMSAVGD